jgi:hypothetical protein
MIFNQRMTTCLDCEGRASRWTGVGARLFSDLGAVAKAWSSGAADLTAGRPVAETIWQRDCR